VGPVIEILCGLSQDLLVSPILFLLYISPLFRLGRPKARFGYADDAAILAISLSLEINCQSLLESLQEILNWGSTEGITFAPDKYELIHFTRRIADQDPSCTLSVSAGQITISENTTRPYLRWLGFLFDKKLSFKYHVKDLASKALTIANALRKVYFGAETWWPGRARPGPRIGSISNQVQGHLDQITKAILAGVRVILPVYRTTSIPVLHQESGFSPAEVELDYIAASATVCLRRLDPYHPL
jgi:hypothetical protein